MRGTRHIETAELGHAVAERRRVREVIVVHEGPVLVVTRELMESVDAGPPARKIVARPKPERRRAA